MKILQINKFYYPRGGPEFFVRKLEDAFGDLGHETIVFSMKDPRNWPSRCEKYFLPPVNFSGADGSLSNRVRVLGRMFYSLEARRKLKELIRREKPDLAHIHNIYHHISPSVIDELKAHNIPVVMTLHDYKLLCPNYYFYDGQNVCEDCQTKGYISCIRKKCVKGSSSASALCALEGWLHLCTGIYQRVDAFIALSQFMIDCHKRYGHYDPRKFYLLRTPVESFDDSPPQQSKGDFVLYVGGMEHHKGIEVLLTAADHLPEVCFVLAGGGTFYDTIEREKAAGRFPNVQLLGYVSDRKKLQNYFRNCLCVVVPSICYENTPTVVVEAFREGKPVVASDLGAIPEMVKHQKTGLLFRSGDGAALAKNIRAFIEDDEAAVYLGKNAFNSLCTDKSLSARGHAEALIEIYTNLIDQMV